MASSHPESASDPNPPLDLTITLCAFREAENLATLLPAIHLAAAALTPNYEILVIDTQQPLDDTPALCARHNARHIPRTGGNTYGDAVRTAIAHARGTWLLNLDADGSHSPTDFAALYAQRHTADIVIGSRYAPGGSTTNPLHLRILSRTLNTLFALTFHIPARDLTNSFRLYRRNILTQLQLKSSNFDILEEILIQTIRQTPPARITEVPITFNPRLHGQSKRRLIPFTLSYLQMLLRGKEQ